ncbi:uncharacterized protein LOC131877184 isoform X1 [Tigriopus californicus]|uniref:uncharacterized protein LOC131877184 isoform X1 n=1 Tax=Tigriopus californicus TaxID=6832 RepID=UPI0027D9E489|nr:uncharacterized protein LOC131877184 isoform X1 [Tigriopus californicus]
MAQRHPPPPFWGSIDPLFSRPRRPVPPPSSATSSQFIHLHDPDSDLDDAGPHEASASPVIRTQIHDTPTPPAFQVVRNLNFDPRPAPPLPPTQAILESSPDSSCSISQDLFDEGAGASDERMGSPRIETISSGGGVEKWVTPPRDEQPDLGPGRSYISRPPTTSSKKRRKKIGLAAKLDLVWRESQTDRLLKTHIQGVSAFSETPSDGDLCLYIDQVTDYRAFKNLTCHSSIQSDRVYQVAIQPADLPQVPWECLVSGTEIRIPFPFYTSSRLSKDDSIQVIFGIKRLEILDQAVVKSIPESTLFSWQCPCFVPHDPI